MSVGELTAEDVANRDRFVMGLLAAPIPEDRIKTRSGQGGRQLRYIQVPTVIERLDEAVGPENWETEVTMGDRWVRCRLIVTLPSGKRIGRDGIGGYPPQGGQGMTEEDSVKGGESDAFKRAGAKFGIGLNLYVDAEPHHHGGGEGGQRRGGGWGAGDPPQGRDDRREPARGGGGNGNGNGKSYGPPKSGRALFAWAKDNNRVDAVNALGKRFGLSGRMVDWDEVAVAEVYGKLTGRGAEDDSQDDEPAY